MLGTDSAMFRTLATDWHGGQSSAMYRYASTGTVVVGLGREIKECVSFASRTNYHDVPKLMAFLFYIRPIETKLVEEEDGDS